MVGSLVGSGISLRSRPVVTTTWKEWQAKNPSTTVLSIDTGFSAITPRRRVSRFFRERPVDFPVSQSSSRLPNKAEVLVTRLADGQGKLLPVAIDARFLRAHPVYTVTAGDRRYVVVTSQAGANRMYQVEVEVPEQPTSDRLRDTAGNFWTVTEDALVRDGDPPSRAPRVAAQRAFWFGWYAQFPDTLLVK